MHECMVIRRAMRRHADALAAGMLLKSLLPERQRAGFASMPQMQTESSGPCRTPQCVCRSTQQDEDQVFEDYFQIQVAPCHGSMHRVQYLMVLHERAGVCGRAVSTPGWLAAGVSYPENMPYGMCIRECLILCGQSLGFWPTCGMPSSGQPLQGNIMPLAWS